VLAFDAVQQTRQVLRSPDAIDAAGTARTRTPRTPAVSTGHAGIGAGALLGLIVLGLGVLLVVHRRHARPAHGL
jgi:hypothetical protein